jgi:signal transduction histidine kinase
VSVKRSGDGRLSLRVSDNGHGFHGDLNRLGKLFVRHTRGSGSGVGLYIVRQLVKRMNGTINFTDASPSGFLAEMDFPNAGTSDSIRPERASYEATVAGRR